jgi:hypothetical protein
MVSNLWGDEDLAWWFMTWNSGMVVHDLEQRHASGGDCTGEDQSLTFQGENPRSDLNWLYLAMALLKALF